MLAKKYIIGHQDAIDQPLILVQAALAYEEYDSYATPRMVFDLSYRPRPQDSFS